MKKRIAIISSTLVVGVIGIHIFIGMLVFNKSMQMVDNESTNREETKEIFKELDYDLNSFESTYTIETIKLKSTLDGHIIPSSYISVDGNKNKDTVIMVHGLGGNRWANYPIAEIFLAKGYNVVSYDQRSSGENTAQYTTYGYLESNDLADYVSYVKKMTENNKQIGIWGTSFGGATTGIFLGSNEANEYIDFAILDSPLSNMKDLLSIQLEQLDMWVPVNYILSLGNIVTKMKLGFSYRHMNVMKYMSKTKVPVLILHSKKDKTTPYFMGEDLYNTVLHTNKSLFTVEDSKHTEIFLDYPDEYEKEIFQFIH